MKLVSKDLTNESITKESITYQYETENEMIFHIGSMTLDGYSVNKIDELTVVYVKYVVL